MADEGKSHDAGAESHDGSSGASAPAAAPARSEQRSEPVPHFDHSKAWSEAFSMIADMPEKLLNALEERASSRKKEEKQPEEKIVHQESQEDEKIEAPTPGGKGDKVAVEEMRRKPWGHKFLEPRKRGN